MKFLKRKKADANAPQVMNRYFDILLRPVITEKSHASLEKNKVMFHVSQDATKPEIKSAVEALFKVKVKSVNTMVRGEKEQRFRQTATRAASDKRAIVTLEAGQSIDLAAGAK